MMLWILFVILIVDLALLLCVCNILLDIKEYLMYKECLNDESDLRDN
jgi:hypothetical protein